MSHHRYDALFGTGGIGSGVFFALNGSHTLGREESRSGRFLDRRDYCKLHIIAHYMQALMGTGFVVLPIGMVGDDDAGKRLLVEMQEAALDLRHVRVEPGGQTLFSFCFVYPDGSGGNLTVDDSASSHVDPALIREAEPELAAYGKRGIALAVPEVPLPARAELLALAARYGLLRVASFTSGEIVQARDTGLLAQVDLLAVNRDEAAALAGVTADQQPVDLVWAAVNALRRLQPAALLSVTAGMDGSWAWDGRILAHAPAHRVQVASTAGAGDAHFAGLLAGLATGLELSEAQELAALAAALSVTSPHTINKEISRPSLCAFAGAQPTRPSPAVCRTLGLACTPPGPTC